MRAKIYFILLFLFVNNKFNAQISSFSIYIEPMNITGLGGIQSFAVGQNANKWLIVGGRLDGLHMRQPFATFDIAGHNTQLIVVDPITQQKWSAPLTSLPISIQEQLSSTNMEFYQAGNYLYCLGGYGYSNTVADHITYNKLTAIDLPATINAIINGTSFSSYFRQISDNDFAVTGGRLEKINNTYYLVGGHKFIGKYNPMGPTHGPGFYQEYTNAIRKFNLIDDGINITINHLPSFIDSTNLHRRDYNATAQILPNGAEGITAFSGVFQPTIDLPFLNCVNIDSNNYLVNNTFSQYYNHYHCATTPIFDSANNIMHTLFFGGIAQYFDSAGILVQNNNVPFVKTIARVSRNSSGLMTEYKLPIELPNYLGAGAEFIPIDNLPRYANGVLKLNKLTQDTSLIGYIYGGIASTDKNIFFVNTGTESNASSQIFKVYLFENTNVGIDNLNEESVDNLKLQVYPIPNKGILYLQFYLEKIENVSLKLYDVSGKLLDKEELDGVKIGQNYYEKKMNGIENGYELFLELTHNGKTIIQKIIIEP